MRESSHSPTQQVLTDHALCPRHSAWHTGHLTTWGSPLAFRTLTFPVFVPLALGNFWFCFFILQVGDKILKGCCKNQFIQV